jgi:hypothetical protein
MKMERPKNDEGVKQYGGRRHAMQEMSHFDRTLDHDTWPLYVPVGI